MIVIGCVRRKNRFDNFNETFMRLALKISVLVFLKIGKKNYDFFFFFFHEIKCDGNALNSA